MTIQEILEAHHEWDVDIDYDGSQDAVTCPCGWRELLGLHAGAQHRAHVAEVLDKHMQEREAEAVRETARNIERLYPRKGLINRADLLADIEIAADRLGRGIHANGRDKRPANGR